MEIIIWLPLAIYEQYISSKIDKINILLLIFNCYLVLYIVPVVPPRILRLNIDKVDTTTEGFVSIILDYSQKVSRSGKSTKDIGIRPWLPCLLTTVGLLLEMAQKQFTKAQQKDSAFSDSKIVKISIFYYFVKYKIEKPDRLLIYW